jgi:hypothetical protein
MKKRPRNRMLRIINTVMTMIFTRVIAIPLWNQEGSGENETRTFYGPLFVVSTS